MMKARISHYIPILLCLWGAACARTAAATPPSPTTAPSAIIDVWPAGTMPGHGASTREHALAPHGDHVQRITDISQPTLSLFAVPNKGAPAPVMIVCPGGGYSYVVYNKEGTEIATWLNSIGIDALVLKYRVPHNSGGAFQDAQRALSLARADASKWNIDPKRLGIIGFSAGGDLAAKASNRFADRSYQPINAVDKQSCRPDYVVLVYPAYLERNGHLASDLNLHANIPPTLIIHNIDDKNFFPASKLYHAALDKAHIPNKLIVYKTGGHGYGLRSKKDVRVWPQAAEKWLRKIGVLRGTTPVPGTASPMR